MPKLNELLAQRANEQGTSVEVAKAVNLTHALSRMRNPSLDTVIRAMDTQQSGGGADWIMTGFSPDVVLDVSLDRKVSSLFERVPMPGNPYKFPIAGGDPTAYVTPENTADTGQTSVKFSDAGTAGVTFTAKKISVAIRTSDEFQQDSIADVERYVNQKILKGLINGEENALINGSLAGTHPDADTTGSDDVRKSFNGLRSLAIAGAKIDGGSGSLITAIRAARSRMGRYGADPNKLAIIASTSGHIRLLEEGAVLTRDKFGDNATVITGELGKVDGMPLVVSQYLRDDLNATGVYDGTTTTKTQLLIVYRGAFAIGDRLTVQLEAEREAKYGQDVLIGRERIDFQPWYPATDPMVGMVYNIAKL